MNEVRYLLADSSSPFHGM